MQNSDFKMPLNIYETMKVCLQKYKSENFSFKLLPEKNGSIRSRLINAFISHCASNKKKMPKPMIKTHIYSV